MHGLLFKSLKDYVIETHGKAIWSDVCETAAIDNQIYLTIDTYADEELIRLFEATADQVGVPVSEELESYGRFAAGRLLATCRNLVEDDWDALDLIANTDDRIHDVLRARNPDMNPPELGCCRDHSTQVTVEYHSERRLCCVAKGIVRGVGEHYGVQLTVTETACLHEGAEYCELVVTQ